MIKILCVGDPHGTEVLERIEKSNADIVCIAGDLICLERTDISPIAQSLIWIDWIESQQRPTVVCSGNHDMAEELWNNVNLADLNLSQGHIDIIKPNIIRTQNWMEWFSNPLICSVNQTKIFKGIVFTSFPFSWHIETPRDLWEEGQHLARSTNSKWIVVHHEPPHETEVGSNMCAIDILPAIEEYQPDLFICGHIHLKHPNHCFVGKTKVVNPGRAAGVSGMIVEEIA